MNTNILTNQWLQQRETTVLAARPHKISIFPSRRDNENEKYVGNDEESNFDLFLGVIHCRNLFNVFTENSKTNIRNILTHGVYLKCRLLVLNNCCCRTLQTFFLFLRPSVFCLFIFEIFDSVSIFLHFFFC